MCDMMCVCRFAVWSRMVSSASGLCCSDSVPGSHSSGQIIRMAPGPWVRRHNGACDVHHAISTDTAFPSLLSRPGLALGLSRVTCPGLITKRCPPSLHITMRSGTSTRTTSMSPDIGCLGSSLLAALASGSRPDCCCC